MNLPGVKAALPDAIDRLVESQALPLPLEIDLIPDPVVVRMRTPDDVRRWAAACKTHVAQRLHVAGDGTSQTYALIHLVGCLLRLEAPGLLDAPPRAAKGRTRPAAGEPRAAGRHGSAARGESGKDTP